VTTNAMTVEVKRELSALVINSVSARRAEVASLLRFTGGLHIVAGRVIVDAEVDLGVIAQRLRKDIFDLYGYTAVVHAVPAGGVGKSTRYVVRVAKDGEALARQTGLLDLRGRPIRGLPALVVGGSLGDAEAVWRGAFLARGSLVETGRSSALEVSCPGPEAALALVGAARRLGVKARAREVRGRERAVVRDAESIGALLSRMGAQGTRVAWEARRTHREVRATVTRSENFDDANQRRSGRAAAATAAQAQRALEILADTVPGHLAAAGKLRVEHRQASLEELGRLADPPLSKDAVAGRIRRLLSMADRRARQDGVPDTASAVTPELLEEI
jgi:DNA-binding protein WhiA